MSSSADPNNKIFGDEYFIVCAHATERCHKSLTRTNYRFRFYMRFETEFCSLWEE